MDRFPALNGKSLDAKGDVSSIRTLLLQKLYEITFAEIIHWNFDEIHFLVRRWQKLVEKGIIKQGNLKFTFTFDYTIVGIYIWTEYACYF